MINGQFGQWLDEFLQHWHSMLAAGAFVKNALPLQEWVKIAVVAIVTAVVTSQITVARMDERLVAFKSERELLVKTRDAQVVEIRKDVDRIEIIVQDIRVEIARIRK